MSRSPRILLLTMAACLAFSCPASYRAMAQEPGGDVPLFDEFDAPSDQVTQAPADEESPPQLDLERADDPADQPVVEPTTPKPAPPAARQPMPTVRRAPEPMPEREGDLKIVNRREAKCPSPEELQKWFKPLDRIGMSARAEKGEMPIDCAENLFYRPDGSGETHLRNWAPTNYYWAASNLHAQPAYWDDVPLERYGQTISPALQPGISFAKFYGTFFIIPYKIGINRTHDLIYTLGYYRPGSPAPDVHQTLPWEWDAALFEAGALVGIAVILP